MTPAFTVAAATWQNFYLLVGGAAATLTGLMFIAVTFGSSLVTNENIETSRAFLDPPFTHFVQVLITACLMLIPTMGPTLLGIVLVALGVLRIVSLLRVHRHMMAAKRKANDIELSDWVSGIVMPLLAFSALVGTGVAFIIGYAAFAALAAATLAVLVNGIYGAWELMVWLALTRARAKL